MDTYTPLLERTRVPQPSLQKYAVTALFSKLRSSSPRLGPDSDPGRHAISQCLHSSSPHVADQSARELCRLVVDSKLDISIGFMELQSALEGSDQNFSTLFVKSLGFLTRLGFQRNPSSFRFSSTENHPFVKILLCGVGVEAELVKEVVLFMGKGKGLGMERVCEFLRPFLNFAILRVPFSGSSSCLFARSLVSSMAAFCCSFPEEGLPVLRLLTGCFKFLPHKNSEELRSSYFFLECVGDAYILVLRHLVGSGLLVNEAQLFGVVLAETIISLLTRHHGHYSCVECIVELVKRLLEDQKVLDLPYPPELSSTVLSLAIILLQAELGHEQLSLLRLLIFLLSWKNADEIADDGSRGLLKEEILLTLPVIHLLSSASSSVKGVAADLLVMLEKLLMKLLTTPKLELTTPASPLISTPGYIVYRLLHHLWSQDNNSHHTSFFITFSTGKTNMEGMHNCPTKWASVLREYSLWIADMRKSTSPISRQQETFVTDMPLLLSAIASALVMHQSLGNVAIDLLAAIGVVDPKQGVTLLLCVLFYCNIFSGKVVNQQTMLPKLLSMLPSLASHSVMIPLVVQTIMPMLQKDRKLMLYGTATRLLCQTWAVNDRAFESLLAVLHPKSLTEFKFEKHICLSIAACVRDVCKKSPDRGVDLILSISACIESRDPKIQALGFQSLSHLCEADVIDFYTAWEVILKQVLDYSTDPVLALSLCLLLKWGAMDAAAYEEASMSVLTILWDIGTYSGTHTEQWVKARASAFDALTQYQVSLMEKGICDFKKETMNLLLCETESPILKAMEELQVKIIMHEHVTRRRFVKEKKVAKSKIEKLLDVVPQVLFSSGTKSDARQFPGAALLCLSFTIAKDVSQQRPARVKVSSDVHAKYRRAMVEIAVALQLSRNIFLAIYSLQSWKSFMRHWMRANTSTLDAKALDTAADKTTKAATDILKSLMQVSEESIPCSAENIMLAIGALCLVLPPSVHTVKSSASKFLLNWLFQHEHEHRQWSAAISLGLISSCLHVTDHKQKFENITGLLEILHSSKSILVKGACGVGLGFSCQDLLTGTKTSDNAGFDKESYKMQEIDLLGKIIGSLLLFTAQISEASNAILECLTTYFPQVNYNMQAHCNYELLLDQHDNLEEDIWGVAGLAFGLGNSIGALYRAGAHDIAFKLKELIISWIPHVDSLVSNCNFSREVPNTVLSVGSCLVLPIVVAFCLRVEIMNDSELDYLLDGFSKLISELLSVNKSGAFHQSLLMAACIGAGNLLCCILNEGVHPVEVDCIKHLLDLFRQCYSGSYHPFIRFGGMLGVVNAMGAGAGILLNSPSFSYLMESGLEQKESGYLLGNLLSSPLCKSHLETLIQEIFLIAQDSDDLLMQQNAAWVVSFLRNHFWSREFLNVESSVETNVGNSKAVPHSLSEDSSVVKLSEWLSHMSHSGTGTTPRASNVSTVLRCLSQAPRLPAVDWGLIIRRCMKYEDQVFEVLPDSALVKGTLREQCLQFSLAHANQFDAHLSFLDELSNLSRFRTLELNLQSCFLFRLAGLVKVFSGSRLDKLFDDIVYYFSSDSLYLAYKPDQKRLLRISCWSGLYSCLHETSLESTYYISNFEKCMEVLFGLLPSWESSIIKGANEVNSVQEWYEAVKCLAIAPADWLLKFLQLPLVEMARDHKQLDEFLKRIVTKAKLVRMGCVPSSELGSVKSCILNHKSNDVWSVLVEIVAALQSVEGSVKRQWLVDAIEISCVSRYPSTAVQFFGLLCGSCCKYMPVLTLDDFSVLNDLPVTVASILSEPAWQVVADSVVSSLWTSTERLYDWTACSKIHDDTQSTPSIDESEEDKSALLLRVMHQTCVSLKEYLPLEKQLRLANMIFS